MPKHKGKRGKLKNQIVEEKKKCLEKLWDMFQSQQVEYENYLNTVCRETCERIRKMYDDKLTTLPENIRNMTLSEYVEAQRKAEHEKSDVTALQMITSEIANTKLMSEKKKTLKKNRTEKKRSLSVSVCSGKTAPSNFSRVSRSRVLSESCLSTPRNNKHSMMSSFVITPKFNPKVPVSKVLLRKPRAGEVVLSVSGSPIQNFADDPAISLGAGNIIKITDDREISKMADDFMKKCDETTKLTLQNVKKQLDLILKSANNNES